MWPVADLEILKWRGVEDLFVCALIVTVLLLRIFSLSAVSHKIAIIFFVVSAIIFLNVDKT